MSTTRIIFLLVAIAFGFFVYLLKKEEQPLEKMTPQDKEKHARAWQWHAQHDLSKVDIAGREEKFPSSLAAVVVKDEQLAALKQAIHTKVIGQDGLINWLLIGLLTGGHILIEGVPWLAKTKTVTTLADLLHVDCKRVQCTPDMLPSDLTGSEVFHHETKKFEVVPGPLFAHIVLADEINRTTPKVQAALLEAMQEQQVTIWGKTLALPQPFFVLATQNPLDHEGTYPLPEAQVDRFLCKIIVTYPEQHEEIEMLREAQHHETTKDHQKLWAKDIVAMQENVRTITISDELMSEVVALVRKTRLATQLLAYGASPRASLALVQAAKAVAYLTWRKHVMRNDIDHVALSVLRHRVAMTYYASQTYSNVDKVLRYVLSM